MTSTIYITTSTLKTLLSIFEPTSQVKTLRLGDTCHPSSGYIDEKIVAKISTVEQYLAFNYSFPCLIEFSAEISQIKVDYIAREKGQEEYKLIGATQEIVKVHNHLIALEAINPGVYIFEASINY